MGNACALCHQQHPTHLALVQRHDGVCVAHGGQPVCNHQHCAGVCAVCLTGLHRTVQRLCTHRHEHQRQHPHEHGYGDMHMHMNIVYLTGLHHSVRLRAHTCKLVCCFGCGRRISGISFSAHTQNTEISCTLRCVMCASSVWCSVPCRTCCTRASLSASSAEVASSRMSSEGLRTRARAMAMR